MLLGVASNPLHIKQLISKRWTLQAISNAMPSVDTFFVLSGFLTAYLFFKRNGSRTESVGQKIKTVLMMYLHRYLRLTPALAILMCFSMTLPLYLTSGPFAATKESLTGTCDKWWWYNILYINNFDARAKSSCVGW